MLDSLNKEERLRLMKFVCSFAWADLEISPAERELVQSMIERLDLKGDERTLVEGWLEVPPEADEVDPEQIPREHRQLFLDAAKIMILSDGTIDQDEAENLALLEQLLV